MQVSDASVAELYWDERASRFEREFEASPIRRTVIRRIASLAQPRPGESLADVGVGTARVFTEHPDVYRLARQLVGVDISTQMLAQAVARCRAAGLEQFESRQGLFTQIPLADGTMDCVVSSLAMHHITDDEKRISIGEFRRILKPGGRIVVADQINCFARPVTEEEFQREMVRTFFPDKTEEKALLASSDHKEYSCTKDAFVDMFTELGFKVQFEKVANVIGILYTV